MNVSRPARGIFALSLVVVFYGLASSQASPAFGMDPGQTVRLTPTPPPKRGVVEILEAKPPDPEPSRSLPLPDSVAFSSSAPDAFGYTFTDSNEASGPSFSWVDISGTGTDLGLTDDSYFYPIDLPFVFDFYGSAYTQIAVGSNGTIYFEDNYLGLENTVIPSINGYGIDAFIAVYWDDLDPSIGGTVYYELQGSTPDRRLIVQWDAVSHYGNPGDTISAQAILFEGTHNILVQYLDPSSESGSGASAGIQADSVSGLQYTYNTPSIEADLAVCYAYPGGATDCSGPGLRLEKTVGLDPGVCASTDLLIVPSGTEVTYCYTGENISGIAFTRHDLVDSELGAISSSLPITLNPGESYDQKSTAILTETTSNTGTWTAYNPGPTDVISAQDDATVLVPVAEPLACNGPAIEFENGIPMNWSIVDDEENGVVWTLSGESGYPFGCGEGNYTDGSGYATCVSSEYFGATEFDTSLVSPSFDLNGQSSAELSYLANYQNFSHFDYLDLDISDDGGASWTTLLSWNDDFGAMKSTPGELVVIDLSSYAGSTGYILRWRYYDPNTDDFAWYAQVDEISLSCTSPDIDIAPTTLSSTQTPDEIEVEPFTISNLGTADLIWSVVEGLSAGGCIPTDLPWISVAPDSGTTSPGGDQHIDISFDSAGLAVGIYTGELCIPSDDPDEPMLVVPLTLMVEPAADLALTKVDEADPIKVGTTVRYTLTVENLGPSEATSVILVDTLSPEATYLTSSPDQGSCSHVAGVVTCDLVAISNGSTVTVTVDVVAPRKSGSMTNEASVSATELDPTPSNNATTETTTVELYHIYLPLVLRN